MKLGNNFVVDVFREVYNDISKPEKIDRNYYGKIIVRSLFSIRNLELSTISSMKSKYVI